MIKIFSQKDPTIVPSYSYLQIMYFYILVVINLLAISIISNFKHIMNMNQAYNMLGLSFVMVKILWGLIPVMLSSHIVRMGWSFIVWAQYFL